MTEYSFNKVLTKAIEIEKDSDKRIFTAYITSEVIDKQGEIIFVDEIFPVLEKFMKRNPAMTEIHSNRITGMVHQIEKSFVPEFPEIPAIKCKCEIYKEEDHDLFDRVWKKIVDKEYTGLSIGGASKTREHFIKNGRPTVLLKDLEIYEFAICPSPANQFAKIEWVNEFAKSDGIQKGTFEKKVTQCDNLQCVFEKGLNLDADIDINNKKPDKTESKKSDVYKDLLMLKSKNTLSQLLN